MNFGNSMELQCSATSSIILRSTTSIPLVRNLMIPKGDRWEVYMEIDENCM